MSQGDHPPAQGGAAELRPSEPAEPAESADPADPAEPADSALPLVAAPPGEPGEARAPGQASLPASGLGGLQPRTALLVLLLGLWLIFLCGLGARPYGSSDVDRYARMVVEMQHEGTLIPTLSGQSYHEAAPLAAWGPYAVAWLCGGQSQATVRLLSGLSLLGAALLAWALGREISPRLGLVAGAATGLNHLAIHYGRSSRVDALLGFAVTAAIAAGFLGTRGRGARRWGWFALAGAACALAIAAKGPYGGALVAAVLVPFWIWEREWRATILGGAIMLSVGLGLSALWLLPYLSYLGPEEAQSFFDHFFLQETISKFEGGLGKVLPPWQYLLEAPPKLLPWSLLAGLAVISLARRRGQGAPLERLALCWVLFPVVLLSLASGKHIRYLVPLLPGLALLAAFELERWFERWPRGLSPRAPALALGAALVVLGVAGPSVLCELGERGSPLAWAAALGLGSCGLGLWTLARARGATWGALTATLYLSVCLGVGFAYAGVLCLPTVVARYCPAATLAAEVEAGSDEREAVFVLETDAPHDPVNTICPSELALPLGRWVGSAPLRSLPPGALVLSQRALPGRTPRREFRWSGTRRGAPQTWFLLGPRGSELPGVGARAQTSGR